MSWKLSCRPICTRLHHSGDSCQICQFATHRRTKAMRKARILQNAAGMHEYFLGESGAPVKSR
jgi:hypothetical protein